MSEELPGNTMELIKTASGVVLDIGPADGSLLHLFDPSKIAMAYGPEPAVDMHPRMRENIQRAGLTGKYEPLAAGAEPESLVPALASVRLIKADGSTSEGIFDTVIATRVLCGVHNPEETAKLLFTLLKSGGRMLICEHVTAPWPTVGTPLGYVTQTVYWALGWNFWMGGCTINRDTVKSLKIAGGDHGWKQFDLKFINAWHPVPFVVGVLVKA
jgi:SAM-dependent methyltransferase